MTARTINATSITMPKSSWVSQKAISSASEAADEARTVDVLSLASSRGGTGHPVPAKPFPVKDS